MQIAHHEPAIRHALIALGDLHEHYELLTHPDAPRPAFAMQQYMKSLHRVASLDISRSDTTIDVALVSCVLFAAFESLQGHYQSALTHIRSGVKILSEHDSPEDLNRETYLSRDVLLSLFVRLDTQAMEIGDEAFRPNHVPIQDLIPIPHSFSSVEQANICFDVAFNHLLHFMQKPGDATTSKSPSRTPFVALEVRSRLIDYFQKWSIAFEKSCFSPTHPAVLILQVYRIFLKIIWGIDLLRGERGWDILEPDFEKLVDAIEAFLRHTADQSAGSSSDTSMGQANQSPRASVHFMRDTDDNEPPRPLLGADLSQTVPNSELSNTTEHNSGFLGIDPKTTPFTDAANVSLLDSETFVLRPHATESSGYAPVGDAPDDLQHTSPPSHHHRRPLDPCRPTFTLTLGIISPLFITCSRCRDPTIRRRALHLLLTCNRKEGIWNSVLTGRVAERVISIEEAGAFASNHASNGAGMIGGIVTHSAQIPERARIRDLEVSFQPERRAKVRYSKSDYSDRSSSNGDVDDDDDYDYHGFQGGEKDDLLDRFNQEKKMLRKKGGGEQYVEIMQW